MLLTALKKVYLKL